MPSAQKNDPPTEAGGFVYGSSVSSKTGAQACAARGSYGTHFGGHAGVADWSRLYVRTIAGRAAGLKN